MFRYLLVYILSFTFCFVTSAQNNSNKPEEVVVANLDVLPEFPGGKTELNKFIEKNLRFPEKYIQDSSFKGCKVFVKFYIDEKGNAVDPSIFQACLGYEECDREALRIIRIMPKWIPAKRDNKPIKRGYILPISFKRK